MFTSTTLANFNTSGSGMSTNLYNKAVSVIVKQAGKEDRQKRLLFSIDWTHIGTGLQKQELAIQITDEDDPFLILNLILGEDEYHSLKSQQGLLVDFAAFPKRFIDLLELCYQVETEIDPKYILVLQTFSGLDQAYPTLDVIETNPFRHLVHLSLKFVPGSDNDIKKHLAQSLKHYKCEYAAIKCKLNEVETNYRLQVDESKESLSKRNAELESLKSEWNSRISYLTSTHNNEMAIEKEKAANAQYNFQQQLDGERKELKASHQQTIRQYELKLHEIETHNKELLDSKYRSETILRELKGKHTSLEDEHKIIVEELDAVRKRVSSMNLELQDKERTNLQQQTKLTILNQENETKAELLQENKKLLETIVDEKRQIDQLCDKKQQMISKLESENRALTGDIKKANEIIRNLQNSLKTVENKLKERDYVTIEQEKIISDKEKLIQVSKSDLQLGREAIEKKDNEIKSLTDKIDKYAEKLEESRKQLKTNEQLIEYLNKMLNESQLSSIPNRVVTGFSKHTTQPGSFANRRTYMRNTQSDSALGGIHQRLRPSLVKAQTGSETIANNQETMPGFSQRNTHSVNTGVVEKVSYRPIIPNNIDRGAYNVGTVSEEPVSNFTVQSKSATSNDMAIKPLDPKYFQKADAIETNQPVLKPSVNTKRLNPDVVTGPYTPHSYMSSYFPKDPQRPS